MGTSDDEKKLDFSKQQYNDIKDQDFSINNRFDNYKDPYSTSELLDKYNDYFNIANSNINADAANQMANGVQGNAASLASQGITGGSILNNANNTVRNNIGKNTTDAFRQMNTARSSGVLGILNNANNNNFRNTQAATNVDSVNMANLLAKYDKSTNAISAMPSGKDTTLDDTLATINTMANMYKSYSANTNTNSGSNTYGGG